MGKIRITAPAEKRSFPWRFFHHSSLTYVVVPGWPDRAPFFLCQKQTLGPQERPARHASETLAGIMSVERTAAIRNLAEPLAASLGLELWGVELAGASRPVLRIYVEKLKSPADAEAAPGGVPVSAETDQAQPEAFEDEDGFMPAGVSPEGVSIDQCAELSRMLGLTLDVEGPFAAAWTLEISSPGLERTFFKLEQMRPYIGREVDCSLVDGHPTWPVREGTPGRKKFRGVLEAVSDTDFTLNMPLTARKEDEPEQVQIPWATVRRVSLVHTFPEPGLPGKSKAGKGEPKKAESDGAMVRRGRSKGPRTAGGGKHES